MLRRCNEFSDRSGLPPAFSARSDHEAEVAAPAGLNRRFFWQSVQARASGPATGPTGSSTIKLFAATTLALGLAVSPAVAQTSNNQQGGLVNVNVGNIRPEIAKNINVSENQIPVTVQIPVGVAATVCGVDANVLAQQGRGGTAQCTAKNASTALNQAVQRQVGGGGNTAGGGGTGGGGAGGATVGGTAGGAPAAGGATQQRR